MSAFLISHRCRSHRAASRAVLLAALASMLTSSPVAALQRVTVAFDGAEAPPRSEQFEFMGSSWRGGRIESEGLPGLNASGGFFYVPREAAEVEFAEPVRQVRFFYVHGFGHAPGRASAHAVDGRMLGSIDSVHATFHAAPQGFVRFDVDEPITRVTFDGGVVDSFSYSRVDAGMAIDATFNGAWVNTSHAPFVDGQGMLIEYVPEVESLFVAWFVYDDDGGHRWLTAQGPVSGSSAELEIISTQGGRISRPDQVARTLIGTMSVSFTACDRAQVQVDMSGVVGADASFEITRLRRLVTDHRCN
jgi:hypothetical protein